jgi:uncharacterized membrane protein (DUF2068 family)
MTLKFPRSSRPPSPADLQHLKGLRAVASLECAKGALALAGIFGLFSILHRDPWDVADDLLEFLHINPDRHFAQVFLDFADRITEKNLWTAAIILSAYCTLRFVEAYGLWRARPWAEWFALISGALYVPFEVVEVIRRPTPVHALILIVNLAVVAYMAFLRMEARTRRRQSREYGDAYQPGD